MLFATSLLIIGLILLVYGADRLVYSAAVLSRSLGVAPWLVGCTIVAFGTSLPELLVSVTAALNNQIDMAVGNILGSNIINIMLIVGGAAFIRPVTFRSDIVRRELPLLPLITLLCGLLLADHSLGRLDGVLLLAAGYLLIIVTISRLALHEGSDTLTREQLAELPQDSNNTVAVLWLVLAFIIMPISARMVSDNASVLARYFGLSDLIVGLTVLAIGTSLPELATLVAGALKGENDIALGNVIGSNIFNSVIVLGVPALLPPGPFNPDAFARDYWVMLVASIILAALCLRKRRRINRLSGTLLVCGFIAYLAVLLI
ncbi:inner membrane protein YrbG predicted calcium/sodium:proton antiporter [Candidatus Sodalis pierantonius str. SOPE]|uniref:Inner membrane protein YrbG predicted calcium/sodium:proton antiporter n=1 Tax=Candidatus Sodalis pierantonii str. SOPE TaxID=2342 RepID=W0HGQ5_9GAMM|nr:calcium/sodium antiporter [Candidatus Sodalis pierantonius]AHF72906.1 inner membrane protein YrbG predicted calcium/sodium:proton antiporter [Candidatus Sodalis pierantonius str. SOPE]